jgi:hypothetical protein
MTKQKPTLQSPRHSRQPYLLDEFDPPPQDRHTGHRHMWITIDQLRQCSICQDLQREECI